MKIFPCSPVFIGAILFLISNGSPAKEAAKGRLFPGRQAVETLATYPGPFERYWEGEVKTEISVKLGKRKSSLNLSMAIGETSSPDKYRTKPYWGCDCKSVAGQRVITEMKIVRNGMAVDIPFAAYEDLIDAHEVTVKSFEVDAKNPNAWYLVIKGSDAGESYTVRFTFTDSRLVKREAWSNEFPEHGAVVARF